MDCPQCGASNLAGVVVCTVCGRAFATPYATVTFPVDGPAGPLPSMLGWAIAATLLCIPVGVVSLVYAAQAGTLWQRGDYYGALSANAKARTWAWVSLGAAVLYLAGCFCLGVALGVAVTHGL